MKYDNDLHGLLPTLHLPEERERAAEIARETPDKVFVRKGIG